MVFFECIFQSLNNYICTSLLGTVVIGGRYISFFFSFFFLFFSSIVIHMFGAYFGLAATLCLSPKSEVMVTKAQFANSSYDSDTFSLLATFLLFIFWPSFNAATAGSPALQALSVLNTVIALVGSGFTALAASRLLRKSNHWTLEDLQNSVLAGGVAMGSSAAWNRQPGVALAFGITSGFLRYFFFFFFFLFFSNSF
jgi:ammonium transporter Rh